MEENENIYFYNYSDFSNKDNYTKNSYFHDCDGKENDDNLRISQYSNNDLSFNINPNSRNEDYENFYNSIEGNNISAEENHIKKKIKIKIYNKKLDYLDRIDNKFRLCPSKSKNNGSENEEEEEKEGNKKEEKEIEEDEKKEDEKIENEIEDISSISETNDEYLENSKSFNMDAYFNKECYYSYIENIILKFTDLINNYKKINKDKIYRNTYIRCFLNKRIKNHDKQCNCVPLIECKRRGIFFICEKQLKKYIRIDELLKLILNGELFAKIQNNNDCLYTDKDKKKVYDDYNYNINDKLLKSNKDLNNENEIFNYKKAKKKISKFKKISNTAIEYKIKYFNELSNEYNNKVNNNDNLKKKIGNVFNYVCEKINIALYCIIIKALIKEYEDIIKKKKISKYELIIEQNILHAQLVIKKNKLKNNKKVREREESINRILWIIQFYSEEQIKNNIDKKNIFISIDRNDNVIIFKINYSNDLNKESDELFQIIKKQNVDLFQPQQIFRLNCFNNIINNEKNNFFLLCSPNKHKALIILVTDNFQTIETYQKIIYHKGLYSSVEFHYYGLYYLLNVSKIFTLWYYEEKTKTLGHKEIFPKINQNVDKILKDDKKLDRPIIYIESRKIFILQIFNPIISIQFYEIDTETNEFNLKLIKNIILGKEENNEISNSYNNSCVFKDKYLIIGAKRNETIPKDGGIYIIDLDNFHFQMIHFIKNCQTINSLLNIGNNMIICSSKIYNSKSKNNIKKKQKKEKNNKDKNNDINKDKNNNNENKQYRKNSNIKDNKSKNINKGNKIINKIEKINFRKKKILKISIMIILKKK